MQTYLSVDQQTHFLAGVIENIEEDLEEREVGEKHLGTLPGRVLRHTSTMRKLLGPVFRLGCPTSGIGLGV